MQFDERFPKQLRLRKSSEFQRVYRNRCSAADDCLIVYAAANGLEFSRLGLAVSRKVGGAVRRGRWKRLIREAFRKNRRRLPIGWDLVVLPKQGIGEPDYETVLASLLRLVPRAIARNNRLRS